MGQKVKMSIKGELIVSFNIYLAKKLGFNHLMGYSQGDHHAQYPSNMSQETVPTLFVYCDVLEHVVVGDVMAPLLRIVDMSRKKSYGRMHQVLNPPVYVPVQKKHFDTIEINIMTDTGDVVPFVHGKRLQYWMLSASVCWTKLYKGRYRAFFIICNHEAQGDVLLRCES